MLYIGCFEIEKGEILLGDPMATEITAKFYKIRLLNMSKMRIDGAKSGIWNCYHIFDTTSSYPVALMLSHTNASLSDITSFEDIEANWNYEGKVCCSFSHTICAIDEKYYEKERFAYAQYDDGMLYQIAELKKWCMVNMAHDKNRTALLTILDEKTEEKEEYIEAAEISQHLGMYIPTVKQSTRWNTDCVLRCENQHMAASTIKGGAVSKCYIDFSSVYSNSEKSAIYISLAQGEPLLSIPDNNRDRFRVVH